MERSGGKVVGSKGLRVISFGRWHSSTVLASIAFRSKLNETTVLT